MWLLAVSMVRAAPGFCPDDGTGPSLVPNGDPAYDRFVSEFEQFLHGLVPRDVRTQLGPGMAGLYDADGLEIGRMWTVEKPEPDAYVEHWFVAGKPSDYDGAIEFSMAFLSPTPLAIPQAYTNGTWLRMDVQQTYPPGLVDPDLMSLSFRNAPGAPASPVSAWAYDVVQGGEPRGWLLRVRTPSDVWVDFWAMQDDYALVSVAGTDDVTAEMWPETPANTPAFLESVAAEGYDWFAVVPHKPKHACAFN